MNAMDSALATGTELLTLEDLHLALTRCMAAHPQRKPEHRMDSDANIIAGLWGAMNYERRQSIPLDEVEPNVTAAYRRWGPEFGQGVCG